jgi:hypothetical protein
MPKTEDTAPSATPPADAAPGSEYLREQDKGGRDPVSPAVEPSKADPVDVAPNEPYPTGGATPAPGVPHNAPPEGEAK